MSILSSLSKHFNKDDVTLTLIGPPNSGKTTLIKYLSTSKPVEEDNLPTMGVQIRREAMKIDKWTISTIDTGGQYNFMQMFWETAIEQATCIIFVIDATIRKETDEELFNRTLEQIDYSFNLIPEVVPILIALNKQDLTEANPMTIKEILELFPKKHLIDRTISFKETSAKYGHGIKDSILWLLESME